jgi:hypothetical protein
MKRYGLPVLIALLLVIGVWIFLPEEKEALEKEDSTADPPAVITMLSDREGAPPSIIAEAGPSGPPSGGAADRPPSVTSYDNRRLMEALAALQELSPEDRLIRIADLLESPYAQERAFGAIAAAEEGILSGSMVDDLAADPDPFVSLQLMGWLRDGFDAENLSRLLEGFRQRGDYNISSLKVWARDPGTPAPAGRALLDMLALEFSGEELQSELRQIAFTNFSKAGNPDIRIEAGIRLAEVMDPVSYARELAEVRRQLPEIVDPVPDPSLQPGSAEALALDRERARLYQERIYADQLAVQATRYNKPPQIIEAEGVPAGPAQFSAAWNMTGLWELDYLASLVERAVVNQEPVQAGSVATIEQILEEAATRNPTAELSSRQAYEARRLQAALPLLSALEDSSEKMDIPPGATPPGS